MEDKILRSCFFYVGDKYKLMNQLKAHFPKDINVYYEPFVGGGSSFINTKANKYILNDINKYIIDLHINLSLYSNKQDELLNKLYNLIDKYQLSCSYRNINVSNEYKKKYIKTYYARYNKDSYLKLRDDYNKDKDILILYLLVIYGFNHMIRFNSKDMFNLPVGNVDFNKNVYNAIKDYLSFVNNKDIKLLNYDFIKFINYINIKDNDFIYFDPPYLISQSEYNKMWDEEDEKQLYELIDKLNSKGIRFGLSNIVRHKGKTNHILKEWMKKYKVIDIKSNYISFNDNTIKKTTREVYITNYERNEETT